MKISIIEEIFYGKRGNGENIKPSVEYQRLIDESYELILKLEKDFTPEQKELFNQYAFLDAGLQSETALTYFAEGFKIGLLIGIEAND